MDLVRADAASPGAPQGNPWCRGRRRKNGVHYGVPRKASDVDSKRRSLVEFPAVSEVPSVSSEVVQNKGYLTFDLVKR